MKNATNVASLVMADVKKAITKIKETSDYTGIHSVYSGFWSYERNKHSLSKEEMVEVMGLLVEKKLIEQTFAKGGYMIYLYGEAPEVTDKGAKFGKLLA